MRLITLALALILAPFATASHALVRPIVRPVRPVIVRPIIQRQFVQPIYAQQQFVQPLVQHYVQPQALAADCGYAQQLNVGGYAQQFVQPLAVQGYGYGQALGFRQQLGIQGYGGLGIRQFGVQRVRVVQPIRAGFGLRLGLGIGGY
jgi:hypothetical protein